MNQRNIPFVLIAAMGVVTILVIAVIVTDRHAGGEQSEGMQVEPSTQAPSDRPSEVGGVYDDKGHFLEDDAGVPKVEETDDVSDEEREDAALEAKPDEQEEDKTRKIAIDWAKAFFNTEVSMGDWQKACEKNASPELVEKIKTIDPVRIPDGPPKYADDNVLIRSSDLGRYTYQIDGAHKGESKTSLLVEVQMNKGKWQVQTFDWTNTNF